MWVLLTTQCGKCHDIPEPTQADTQEDHEQTRSARIAPLYVHGAHTGLLTHYGNGLTGIHHGFGGLVTAHQGHGGHPGPVLYYGHGLGNMWGKGFHNGLLGGHHRVLPLHAARQVSDGNEFNPPIKFVINEHPESNPINSPAFYRLPTDQKLGMPLFHSKGFYEPDLMHSATGTNGHPTARQWHYPDVSDHDMGLEGTHGVGLGVYYGVGTPQHHSKGLSGSHAGLPSALHKMNNIHGTVGLGSYNLAGGPNGFHIGVKEGKTGGLPASSYYGVMIGHPVMVPPVMEIHKEIPGAHTILPYGHENAMEGYQAAVTKDYQGLGNMNNFGLHTDMHTGGTGKYGASEYHGNKYHSGGGYYAMNGYHQGEHDGGYNGRGYPWGGFHGMNGYHAGGYHRGGYNGNKYHLMGHHTLNGYHGMNGYHESGGHRSMKAKHHGSFEFGGSLQQPTLLQTGSQLGDKIKVDQNIMSSKFKGETYLKQEKQDETPYFDKDSSNINYNMEENNESTSFLGDTESKSSDIKEVSQNYTKSNSKININISNGNNNLYETGIPMAAQPSVLSDSEWSDTPYARGLHVDLLHGGTAIVEAESDVQLAEEFGLTEGQSGIPAKHITSIGSGDLGNPKVLQPQQNPQEPGYLLSSINDKLAGGLGFQGHLSNYNVDGKTWTGYDSCKYGNSAVDYSYKLVPFIYQPWCCRYGQDNMTPYLVYTDCGYDLRKSGILGFLIR